LSLKAQKEDKIDAKIGDNNNNNNNNSNDGAGLVGSS